MKYRLVPLNEGHEMPCGITVTAPKTVALVKAINIASALTTLLPGNDFSCAVYRSDERFGWNCRAFPSGQVLDSQGNEIEMG